MPGVYISSHDYSEEELPLYMELYEAVFKGDVAAVEKATIKKALGAQAHVCSILEDLSMTPIHVAIERNFPQVAARLLEIALEQYTPIEPPKPTKDRKTPAINNYELARLMETIKPGGFLDQAGYSYYRSHEEADPNTPLKQINCFTSPAALLKEDGTWLVSS